MRSFIVVLFGWFCSGCVVSATYPTTWPGIVDAAQACPDISGIYSNFGRSAFSLENPQYAAWTRLSDYIFESVPGRVSRVEFSHPADLEIVGKAYLSDGETLVRTFVLGDDCDCRKGVLWIRIGWVTEDASTDGVAIFAERVRIGLAVAEDGSLIGETRRKGVGFVYIAPVAGGEKDFIRWQPAT